MIRSDRASWNLKSRSFYSHHETNETQQSFRRKRDDTITFDSGKRYTGKVWGNASNDYCLSLAHPLLSHLIRLVGVWVNGVGKRPLAQTLICRGRARDNELLKRWTFTAIENDQRIRLCNSASASLPGFNFSNARSFIGVSEVRYIRCISGSSALMYNKPVTTSPWARCCSR